MQGLIWQHEPGNVIGAQGRISETKEKAIIQAVQLVSHHRETQGMQGCPYLVSPPGKQLRFNQAEQTIGSLPATSAHQQGATGFGTWFGDDSLQKAFRFSGWAGWMFARGIGRAFRGYETAFLADSTLPIRYEPALGCNPVCRETTVHQGQIGLVDCIGALLLLQIAGCGWIFGHQDQSGGFTVQPGDYVYLPDGLLQEIP